jgi:hypothetical protein
MARCTVRSTESHMLTLSHTGASVSRSTSRYCGTFAFNITGVYMLSDRVRKSWPVIISW